MGIIALAACVAGLVVVTYLVIYVVLEKMFEDSD